MREVASPVARVTPSGSINSGPACALSREFISSSRAAVYIVYIRYHERHLRASRCAAKKLARSLRAGLAEAVRAARPLGQAGRLVAAPVAVLVVGGAGGDRRGSRSSEYL